MNAEFNWWLLIVGLVAGAGLVWLVIADWSRREEDLSEDERGAESAWIAQVLSEQGQPVDPGEAEHVLALHRAYLRQTGGLAPEEPIEEPLPAEPITLEPTLPMSPEPAAQIPVPEPLEASEPTLPRPNVRARPLSPRGGPVRVESEPPRPN